MSWLNSLRKDDPVLVVNARFNPERKTVETVERVTACYVEIKACKYHKFDGEKHKAGQAQNYSLTKRWLEQVETEVEP